MSDADTVLRFHRDVYPLEAVQSAVTAFGGRARGAVATVGEYHEVVIAADDAAAAAQIGAELANYALAATVAGAAGGPGADEASPPA
ncbi:MAG TPA: HxsD-like protein [Polyangia bacterium]|jgi:uncharacterized protein with GYD domain